MAGKQKNEVKKGNVCVVNFYKKNGGRNNAQLRAQKVADRSAETEVDETSSSTSRCQRQKLRILVWGIT